MNKTFKSNVLLTPEQLLNDYPYAQQIGWNVQQIEFLFDNNLLVGERSDELKISSESFEKVLEFHRKQQENDWSLAICMFQNFLA